MSVKNNLSLAPIANATVPQFVTRVFSDKNGKLFKFTFLVSVINGEIKGQLVKAEPIREQASAEMRDSISSEYGQIFCLPIVSEEKEPSTPYIFSFAPVASPYFSTEFLINTQPTRAPSGK